MDKFKINLTDTEWQELISLSFEPFEFGEGDEFTIGQWEVLAEMAYGKSTLIRNRYYGTSNTEEHNDKRAKCFVGIGRKIINGIRDHVANRGAD